MSSKVEEWKQNQFITSDSLSIVSVEDDSGTEPLMIMFQNNPYVSFLRKYTPIHAESTISCLEAIKTYRLKIRKNAKLE